MSLIFRANPGRSVFFKTLENSPRVTLLALALQHLQGGPIR